MPEAIITVGCPGSGKTTFSRTLDPRSWAILCLDDFRAALWGSKKTYHLAVNTDGNDPAGKGTHPMRHLLHEAYDAATDRALAAGWNVVFPNTHIWPTAFAGTLACLERHGIEPRFRVYLTPLDELLRRNAGRCDEDWVPLDFIERSYAALHADTAWWRKVDPSRLEIVQ